MSAQKFGRYPQYQESGHHWLGEIPAHWDLKPVKHLCSFAGGSTPAKENRRYWDGGTIPWVSPKDMKVFCLSETQDQITEIAVKESSVSIISPGALLMVVRSGILQRTIPVAINSVSVTLNQDMKALTFSRPKGAEYFAYLVQGHVSALLQRWTKEGATVESVEHEFLANDSVPDVPTDERRAIVEFLDYETAKIDALIEKQQQLIALLKEKRQAVISHAVTKGLNPDAPMRDSGVEWLGEVPAHWKVARINKFSHKITNGYVGPTRGLFVDDGIKYLQSLHIKSNRVEFTPTYYVSPEWSASKQKSILREGDVLIVQTGDIGQSACVPAEFAGANCHALIVVATNQAIMSGQYLSWCLNSDYGSQSLKSIQTGALHPHLNCGTVKFLPIPIPPMDEQLLIVERVDDERARYDKLQLAAEEQIDLLQERRTALISAAVTGKIDVRGWKPPESKPQTEAA